jgi:starvation-inducible DNA-binding protein
MSKTQEVLEKILADSYTLMLKTQNYHWNITGKEFFSLHNALGGFYEELFQAIDHIAERIRTLGYKVDGSYENFIKLTSIKIPKTNANSTTMIDDLQNDHTNLASALKAAIKVAQVEDDEATADLLVQRLAAHEKTIWMLKANS